MNNLLLIFVFLFICISPAKAKFSPIGFSFTSEGEGLQFPKKEWDVYGLRTNFLGAENRKVVGIDIGGINMTKELFAGMQFGALNITDKKAIIVGTQTGLLVNYNKGDVYALGIQFGVLANYNKRRAYIYGAQIAGGANLGHSKVFGMQFALYNRAHTIVGAQVGIINYCDNLYGIQFGLLNECKSCLIKIMPGVNIGF